MEKLISGKVREVYDIGDEKLVIVTTDRISSFDVILSKQVCDKGKLLNDIALHWFEYTKDIVNNHIISGDVKDMPEFFNKPEYEGRTVMVKKVKILPFEFIIRGYIFGNMWEAYRDNREFCGKKIEGSYKMAQKLEKPILTVSTKCSDGHDEYISYEYFENEVGSELASKISEIVFKLYDKCYEYAYSKGIIVADTKFEIKPTAIPLAFRRWVKVGKKYIAKNFK